MQLRPVSQRKFSAKTCCRIENVQYSVLALGTCEQSVNGTDCDTLFIQLDKFRTDVQFGLLLCTRFVSPAAIG